MEISRAMGLNVINYNEKRGNVLATGSRISKVNTR